MYSKNSYFQFNNCSQVSIRLGFSVTVPEIRLLSQTNFYPILSPLFIFRFYSVFLAIFLSTDLLSGLPDEEAAALLRMEQ
jgi:hypothetical protein